MAARFCEAALLTTSSDPTSQWVSLWPWQPVNAASAQALPRELAARLPDEVPGLAAGRGAAGAWEAAFQATDAALTAEEGCTATALLAWRDATGAVCLQARPAALACLHGHLTLVLGMGWALEVAQGSLLCWTCTLWLGRSSECLQLVGTLLCWLLKLAEPAFCGQRGFQSYR